MSPATELHPRERSSREFFDHWAKNYDEKRISPWFRYTQEMAVDALDLRPDSRALDVGCGSGYGTMVLASRLPEGRACGADISPGMVASARAKVPPEWSDRVEFIEASSSRLPFEDGAFTHMICTNSFHHYPDPVGTLREMKRVLVAGGQLVMFELAPDVSLYVRAWDRFLRIFEKGHVRYIPSNELGAMLESAGYADPELLVLKSEFGKHGKLYAAFQLWSACRPLGEGPADPSIAPDPA